MTILLTLIFQIQGSTEENIPFKEKFEKILGVYGLESAQLKNVEKIVKAAEKYPIIKQLWESK